MAGSYDKGDRIGLTATFTIDDVVTDPTEITAKVKTPSRVITSYVFGVAPELTKVSTGVYRLVLDLDESGTWFYRFEGTGAVIAAEETQFYVVDSEF